MRFHSAAAFLLAKGFSPRSNNEISVNDNAVNSLLAVPKAAWTKATVLNMAPNNNDDEEDPVAGAFHHLNNDMQKGNEEALQSLRDISDSFKQLASSDISHLFGGGSPAGIIPQGIAAAEESLDTNAPLAGNTFDPPTQQTFYSDAVEQQQQQSFVDSVKQSATFSEPASASSYLENMSSPAAETPAAPAGGGFGSSYLDAIQNQPTTTTTTSTPPSTPAQPNVASGGGSSYLDALKGQTLQQSSYSNSAASTPPPPTPPQQQEQQGVGSSYLEAIAAAQSATAHSFNGPAEVTGTPTTAAAASGSYLDALQGSPPVVATSVSPPGSYLDSIAGAQPEGISYPTTPEPPLVPPQQENNPYMGEPTVAYADPSLPMDAAIMDFTPDNEDVMQAGSAPKIEAPPVSRVRNVPINPGFQPDVDWNQQQPQPAAQNRIGAQRVSGFIPNLQGGQGMNGATNIPEPKPKTPRPVFSKKVSGIHSDYDEVMTNPGAIPTVPTPAAGSNTNNFAPNVPPPRPKQQPMSVFAEKVSGLISVDNDEMMNAGSASAVPLTPEPKPRRAAPEWQNGFAHPTPDVTKPQAPVSVFAKRVKGTADFANSPSSVASSKPEPPRSVFSQKISGVPHVNQAAAAPSRPEPPRSVFSQKISGVPNHNYNGGPPVQNRPEPPRSVFSQKIKGVADFGNNNNNGQGQVSMPKPEPPRSVFSQKIASNVPRSTPAVNIAASAGGDFAANGNVPVPNPRAAPPQQHGAGGVPPSMDFAPDFEEAMDAGAAPREIPLPDYYNGQQLNHQDRLTNLDSSFMVNPDDRIGSHRDEYLR